MRTTQNETDQHVLSTVSAMTLQNGYRGVGTVLYAWIGVSGIDWDA